MTEMSTERNRNAYPLNRDFLASSRLHLQHQVWISSLGYHIHPDVPLNGKTTIAEIGCGTGTWSLEVATQLPSGAKIEAFDLSLAQCPPREWWPGNVTFNKLDIFDPSPDDMIGKYDVVYIRHFICVLQSGDPMPLLSILMNLLKPGG
ncbi:N-methyltransferase tcpN [Pseudocercospora fuligena]|uniref:N-methyltransferase tcpN n=1 Tax=Pseudocercospora fuligena TaxID=685502 RepID=A0A8H6VLC1_9PEZI|nr:N-methyltransferase tcpN [Pseudocercospora fuligena]